MTNYTILITNDNSIMTNDTILINNDNYPINDIILITNFNSNSMTNDHIFKILNIPIYHSLLIHVICIP